MKRFVKKIVGNEQGQAFVLTALLMVVLIVLVASVVDIGMAQLEKRKIQNAVDAAALAGAQELPDDQATAKDIAEQVAEDNGAKKENVQVEFPESNQIEVMYETVVPYIFARVIGFVDVGISAKAVAEKLPDIEGEETASEDELGEWFGSEKDDEGRTSLNFAIFSNNDIKATAGGWNVLGDIHSNGKYDMTISNSNFDGSLEAASNSASGTTLKIVGSNVSIAGTIWAKKIKLTGIDHDNINESAAPKIGLPDFSETIKTEIKAATFPEPGDPLPQENIALTVNNVNYDSPMYVNGDLKITGNNIVINAPIYVENGDLKITGSNIKINSPIYVANGDFDITGSDVSDSPIYVGGKLNITGSNFAGKGVVLASGNIKFTGNNSDLLGGETVCFYSEKDINIIDSDTSVRGILYAPQGTISITSSNQTVEGGIIGNNLHLTASNMTVIGGRGSSGQTEDSGGGGESNPGTFPESSGGVRLIE